jgi:hypothetical protein
MLTAAMAASSNKQQVALLRAMTAPERLKAAVATGLIWIVLVETYEHKLFSFAPQAQDRQQAEQPDTDGQ